MSTAHSPRPLFLVLEGIDGAGTTTQTERLVAHLTRLGRQAHATREPSQGPIGRLLREMLAGGHAAAAGQRVAGSTMALLFAADRRDHLQREIEPALAAGSDVVSDRYLLSSLAYQAEEADRLWVTQLARDVRRPDLTILLDLPIEVAALRRQRAGRPIERYDADSYLAKVARNYRELAALDDGVVVLDGSPGVDEVAAAITGHVEQRLLREST
jgi:dTMP kinase